MPNLYGVANPPGGVSIGTTIGAVDVSCGAGVETNFYDSGLLIAPSQGWFYTVAWIGAVISLGATPPSTLNLGTRLNGGSDIVSIAVSPLLLIANANLAVYYTLPGATSQLYFSGPGAHLQISATPGAQAVTVRTAGTWISVGLFRAPDQ